METVVFCGVSFVLFLIAIAWLSAALNRHNTRPNDHDVVQMTWADTRDLRHDAINGGFWRFLAKLEFFLLVVAGIVILVLLNS